MCNQALPVRPLLRVVLLLALAGALLTQPVQAQGIMQPPAEIDRRTRSIEQELMCQCGCTMGLAVCDCGTADEMRSEIAGMMDQGMSTRQIVASYVEQYGEKVLSAPTRSGFNWTAWITPFAALLAGAVALFWMLRRWVDRFRQAPLPADAPGGDGLTARERQELVDQIDDLLRRNF